MNTLKQFSWALLLGAALVASQSCNGSAQGGDGTDTTKTDTTPPVPQPVAPIFNSPEGVASDGEFIYVSNVGVKLEPQTKDGDGRIMKLNMAANDWIDKDKWAAIKLDAPKGMAIIGKRLWVTDIDRVVEIDLKKVEQSYVYDFSRFNAHFLNDLAVKNDSTLLVSATDINAIFQINLKDQNFEKIKTGEINGPNGLAYDSESNKIYCVEYGSDAKPKGRVLAIDANTGATRQVGNHTGGLDGVGFAADGSLLFSDWNAAHVERMAIPGGTVTEVASDSIKGPADFYYHIPTKQLFLPCMMENQLLILEGI